MDRDWEKNTCPLFSESFASTIGQNSQHFAGCTGLDILNKRPVSKNASARACVQDCPITINDVLVYALLLSERSNNLCKTWRSVSFCCCCWTFVTIVASTLTAKTLYIENFSIGSRNYSFIRFTYSSKTNIGSTKELSTATTSVIVPFLCLFVGYFCSFKSKL
jgi:hypothetical protein